MAPDVFGPFSWFVHQSRGSSKFTAHLFWLLSWLSWQKGLPPLQPNDAPSKPQHVFAAKAEPESLRIFGLQFSFNLKASHQHRKYIFFNFRSFLVHWGIYLTKRYLPFCNSDLHMNNLSTVDDSRTQVIANGLRMSGWQPHGRRYHSGITAHQVKGATVKPVLGSLTCAAARTFTYDTWAADKTTSNLRIWNSSRCLTHSGCHLYGAAHVNFLLHFKLSTCITFSLCYVLARLSLPPESILANKLFLRVENICPNFCINSWLPSRGRFGNGQCKPFEFSLGRYVPCPKLLRMLVGCNFQ